MKQQEIFSSAKWLCPQDYADNNFFILKGRFSINTPQKATLRVLGLGFFHCYINGVRVSDDWYLPLSSDYEPRKDYPVDEIISGHRIYVPEYDVTDMLKDGENVISIHFGGGWYTFGNRQKFGDAKAIWRIFGNGADGDFDIVSSENDKIRPSFVKDYDFTEYELHDYTCTDVDRLFSDSDDGAWENAVSAPALDTEYLFTDCPPDRVAEILGVTKVKEGDGYTIYDCGKNISGFPVIRINGNAGEKIRVVCSEELDADGNLNERFTQGQRIEFICDGKQRTVHHLFTWFAFRYFAVYGNAEPECVSVIHTDAKRNSSFNSDNELLNWIHDTYINTQLTNMHAGIPSDCPHLERRGYTGGGPGGWGCAIVEVPYRFYLHYGDKSVLEDCWPNMLRYFDYLESHSESNLVVTDKEGEWCLGDWCTPVSIVLPAPFVNNYFYIKSLTRCIEIAKIIGKESHIPDFEKRIKQRKDAIMFAYFNKWDGNFLGGQQGANAFAVDIGLGDERTYKNTVANYKKNTGYDTGIFGTDILTRILFEHGDGQLATDLLLSESVHSFAEWKKRGATTFWEYWPESLVDRSHNHPMFGAVTAYLYDYLLGIRAKDGCAGYSQITVSPVIVDSVNRIEGHRNLKSGKVSVSYEKRDGKIDFVITIPENLPAEFVFGGKTVSLHAGENRITKEGAK